MYRETGDERYLNQASQIAGYLLDHPRLPEDGVPYWDFDAPVNRYSQGCICCCRYGFSPL